MQVVARHQSPRQSTVRRISPLQKPLFYSRRHSSAAIPGGRGVRRTSQVHSLAAQRKGRRELLHLGPIDYLQGPYRVDWYTAQTAAESTEGSICTHAEVTLRGGSTCHLVQRVRQRSRTPGAPRRSS